MGPSIVRTLALASALLVSTHALADPHVDGAGRAIAHAVNELATLDHEVDVFGVSRLLESNFANDLIWSGPTTSSAFPRFRATYDPPSSKYGIESIRIEWSFLTQLGHHGLFKSLKLNIKDGYCPTQSDIEREFGDKQSKMPQDVLTPSRAFFFSQPNGEPVLVDLPLDNACTITISRFSAY